MRRPAPALPGRAPKTTVPASDPAHDLPGTIRGAPPRAVLFDLFHTLVHVRADPDSKRYTWDDLGVSQADWERALYADRVGRATGKVRDPVEGIRGLVHDINPTIPVDRIADAALRRMARFERHVAAPDAEQVEAVRRLHRRGVKIALVSNAAWDEISAWDRSPFAEFFHAAIFSCDVGVVKPDRRIYEIALERIGCGPADAVFVGDGGADEHRGAKALGMRTVLVTRYAEETWPGVTAKRRPHADHHCHDVATFADHLLGDTP